MRRSPCSWRTRTRPDASAIEPSVARPGARPPVVEPRATQLVTDATGLLHAGGIVSTPLSRSIQLHLSPRPRHGASVRKAGGALDRSGSDRSRDERPDLLVERTRVRAVSCSFGMPLWILLEEPLSTAHPKRPGRRKAHGCAWPERA